MFNPLKGLGDLNQMRQQAQKMQELLKKEEVTIERQGIKIVIRGDQHVKLVEIDGVVENRIAEAMNEAFEKTQKMAAQKLMEINQ
jgi:DNA-binding protein YbaB